MTLLKYIFWNIFETLLRFIPIPCATGWFPIGNPGPDSPVFLTGNFHLTVLRVKRALRKMDAHLLVADSGGINVWCASTGGHLTNHSVISALKISGVRDKVSHRRIFLPQLAASGVERKTILEKTGWKIIWGPVYAGDIPSFLEKSEKEIEALRRIRFPFIQRLEMASAWAFWITLIQFPIGLLFWKKKSFGLVILIWSVSVLVFLAYPVWGRLRSILAWRWAGSVLVFTVLLLGLIASLFILGNPGSRNLLFWGIALFVLTFVLLIDLPGSTPGLKSSFHQERKYTIAVDSKRCKADGYCQRVCPCGCFEIDPKARCVTVPGMGRCVQCGACIVQCPFDALAFDDQKGNRIDPQVVRDHKLGLSGKRH
jgi:NAD-dependent dihydropyrimidine dehydrogenase PreA subunit